MAIWVNPLTGGVRDNPSGCLRNSFNPEDWDVDPKPRAAGYWQVLYRAEELYKLNLGSRAYSPAVALMKAIHELGYRADQREFDRMLDQLSFRVASLKPPSVGPEAPAVPHPDVLEKALELFEANKGKRSYSPSVAIFHAIDELGASVTTQEYDQLLDAMEVAVAANPLVAVRRHGARCRHCGRRLGLGVMGWQSNFVDGWFCSRACERRFIHRYPV
jgi:hypothetical protein